MMEYNTNAVSRNGIPPAGGSRVRLIARVLQPGGNTAAIYSTEDTLDVGRARRLLAMFDETPEDAHIVRSVGAVLARMATRPDLASNRASSSTIAADLFAAIGGQNGKAEE